MKTKKEINYISLFSGAGIGCFGFLQENFKCIATVEILEKRLKLQRHNNKCERESGYICGDIRNKVIKEKIRQEIIFWKNKYKKRGLDVLISTPPCQGMSIANHKKNDELVRNSLIIESIEITKKLSPKFFVFENVRAFLNTTCTDVDMKEKKIREAIEVNLAGNYHIHYQVLNFKDYGSPSSRTRTLVIGTRKDLPEVTPLDIVPDYSNEKKLREIIGNLPALSKMGEIDSNDIYHNFREYHPKMVSWIKNLKEGQSAFSNKDKSKIPHREIGNKIIYNKNKNGDKYQRCFWDKPSPCVHTRNDILSSQNTIHPKDNRVFSIRELMRMMSIPDSFRWTDIEEKELNKMTYDEKKKFLFKEEINIRQSIGEGVPTIIFGQIANKIKKILLNKHILNDVEINKIIENKDLADISKLKLFIKDNLKNYSYPTLSKIAELANSRRLNNAAFYTRQDICYSIIKDLPHSDNYKSLKILEPAIGVGNFLPLLIKKYKKVSEVNIDVVDIDKNSIFTLKLLLKSLKIPGNFKINYIVDDFLLHDFDNYYDIIIGNPPYKKITNKKELLAQYKKNVYNNETNNIFSFFIEKCLAIGNVISLIVPKSLINAPEFNKTRELLSKYQFKKLVDYGEKGFNGVKIETISFIINTKKNKNLDCNIVEIESYIIDKIILKEQGYIFSDKFPYWLIYRDKFFDSIFRKLKFDIFNVFRDRKITKKITKDKGEIRVLKSRNIRSNNIIDLKDYDCYIDDIKKLGVLKFMNDKKAVLVPNLTYYPRACFMPKNSITDGSVAILTPKNGDKITKKDLGYYNTDEFQKFYMLARNKGTRSLNIDNNSVFFFGLQKNYGK